LAQLCRPQYGRFMNSPLYDAGLREKSNTHVRIKIKITPKANIQKYFSHRPGCLSAFIGLKFITTRGRLIFRLYAIIRIAHHPED
ncbi:MAG: hypothetical protein ACFFCW_18850, partial [Candidatus Hodarchaeota archaeon]